MAGDVETARKALAATLDSMDDGTFDASAVDAGDSGTEGDAYGAEVDVPGAPVRGTASPSRPEAVPAPHSNPPSTEPHSVQRAAASLATSPPPTARPNRIQLIDADQQFHVNAFQNQLREWGLEDAGFGYDICAVLGSQSTGKSTLLNRLFGTNFDVMDNQVRKQTTRGIWLCRGHDRNVLVMDVEGTDGRERGEDQDFERKSALFALTTAECLIVNMWENQVGLYQGANMGLLKTVLDVNLSLFQASRLRTGAKEKTLLCFVIRDFIGTTPLENLQETILTDLRRIWAGLSKPEALQEADLSDFFDFTFTTLPHKLLLADEFEAQAAQLQGRFLDPSDGGYVFQTQYHKRIPVDGLPHYLEGIWEQIEQNKDLDLPTQQELLAQFRCDELATAAAAAFAVAVRVLQKALDAGTVHATLGADMAAHRGDAISAFDQAASRYHQGVYTRKRADLLAKLNATLYPFFLAQLRNLHTELVAGFRGTVLDGIRGRAQYHFGRLVQKERDNALAEFDAAAAPICLPDTDWDVNEAREQLESEMGRVAVALRADECRKAAAQGQNQIKKALNEPIELALAKPHACMWDEVLHALDKAVNDATSAYLARVQSLDGTPEEDAAGALALQRGAWERLIDKVHAQTADTVLFVRLRNFFEDRFRYGPDGVPRVWKPSDDMDSVFVQARDATLRLVPLYARIAPTDAALLTPYAAAMETAPPPSDDEEPLDFDASCQILTELQCSELGARVRRDSDAFCVEAQRGTVSSMSQVPMWMYGVLVVLGWNEAMAVLRSPVYFTLLILLLTGAYVVWRLNLSGPLLTVTRTLTQEVQKMTEDYLRASLAPPPLTAPVDTGEMRTAGQAGNSFAAPTGGAREGHHMDPQTDGRGRSRATEEDRS
ncbi:Dynamin-like GTPase that mediates homotypic ER fusion [Malassezia sp. CBS 17886]|nr:Dynamin-like GTPase that mediates homotypic ER fusion [Malassezia sp. CBS 17886]